jgi:hypothetical protein
MAAGFIDPEPLERVRPARKAVLAVVTASWQVLLFDHNLALLWEAAVADELPRNARLAEVRACVRAAAAAAAHTPEAPRCARLEEQHPLPHLSSLYPSIPHSPWRVPAYQRH